MAGVIIIGPQRGCYSSQQQVVGAMGWGEMGLGKGEEPTMGSEET